MRAPEPPENVVLDARLKRTQEGFALRIQEILAAEVNEEPTIGLWGRDGLLLCGHKDLLEAAEPSGHCAEPGIDRDGHWGLWCRHRLKPQCLELGHLAWDVCVEAAKQLGP